MIEPFAEEGNRHARELMGLMYAFGLGVPVDAVQAQIWYRLAECECAEPARSEFGTALDYSRGSPGPRDAQLAAAWLQRAAEGGNPKAQRLISDAGRARSEGFAVSDETAEYWRRVLAGTKAN